MAVYTLRYAQALEQVVEDMLTKSLSKAKLKFPEATAEA